MVLNYSKDEIQRNLLTYIDGFTKKYILLEDIYAYLKANKKDIFTFVNSADGYLQFYEAIQGLVDKGIIEKLSVKNSNHRQPALDLKYKIVFEKTTSNTDVLLKIMNYSKILDMSYYLAHQDEFVNDEEKIKVIYEFIQSPDNIPLTIHERSWQLFGDEKYLKDPKGKAEGEVLLRNLKLSYQDLNCYYMYEPFVYHKCDSFDKKSVRTILIVENKDTFWSFYKLLFETSSQLEIDMLIYGAGNKITSSFQFTELLGLNKTDEILYFGDLDREGLAIYARLVKMFSGYNITFMSRLYELMLNFVVSESEPLTKANQNSGSDAKAGMESLLSVINPKYSQRVINIIDSGKYIPQEALNYERLLYSFGAKE